MHLFELMHLFSCFDFLFFYILSLKKKPFLFAPFLLVRSLVVFNNTHHDFISVLYVRACVYVRMYVRVCVSEWLSLCVRMLMAATSEVNEEKIKPVSLYSELTILFESCHGSSARMTIQ